MARRVGQAGGAMRARTMASPARAFPRADTRASHSTTGHRPLHEQRAFLPDEKCALSCCSRTGKVAAAASAGRLRAVEGELREPDLWGRDGTIDGGEEGVRAEWLAEHLAQVERTQIHGAGVIGIAGAADEGVIDEENARPRPIPRFGLGDDYDVVQPRHAGHQQPELCIRHFPFGEIGEHGYHHRLRFAGPRRFIRSFRR